jgi:hypothetical protein
MFTFVHPLGVHLVKLDDSSFVFFKMYLRPSAKIKNIRHFVTASFDEKTIPLKQWIFAEFNSPKVNIFKRKISLY